MFETLMTPIDLICSRKPHMSRSGSLALMHMQTNASPFIAGSTSSCVFLNTCSLAFTIGHSMAMVPMPLAAQAGAVKGVHAVGAGLFEHLGHQPAGGAGDEDRRAALHLLPEFGENLFTSRTRHDHGGDSLRNRNIEQAGRAQRTAGIGYHIRSDSPA